MHLLDESTRIPAQDGPSGEGGGNEVPALTVVWHPDLGRVGEVCPLPELARGEPVRVSRLMPLFSPVGPVPAHPRSAAGGHGLQDNHLSRTAPSLEIVLDRSGRLELRPGGTEVPAEVYGAPLDRPTSITPAELGAGVILTLGRRVVLCLHRIRLPLQRGPDLGLVGGSDVMENVRRSIRRVASLDVPVLVRGETGTGKEMVARALVQGSVRASRSLVSVNVAAISPSTAVAELFGHERGAFTGAAVSRGGYFGQADGGTLFLDEVGLLPRDLQPMLLRALESGEIFPLGGARGHRSDVRIISATDADLEAEIAARSFSEALFQRLAGFQIVLPPLRQRRADIGQLLLHFLQRELEGVGALDRLAPRPEGKPWLSAAQVARLAMGAWPGNVRALRNAVRQMVITSQDEARAIIDEGIERLMDSGGQAPPIQSGPVPQEPSASPTPSPAPVRSAREIDLAAFFEAYRRSGWSASATAAALGIPRTTVITLRDRHPQLRNPNRISPVELRTGLRDCNGDLGLLAERLQVSRRGLQLRLSQLSQDAAAE